MAKFSAISIGPIFKTIKMARKPKQLWAASYLFSLLMKCIIEQIPDKKKIISPKTEGELSTDVGLYPDRLFIEGEINQSVITKTLDVYSEKTGLSINTIKDYFNIMTATVEAADTSKAIESLNNKLDCLELFERAIDSKSEQEVLDLIGKQNNSKLFSEAFGTKYHSINEMKDIACNKRDMQTDKSSYNSYFCIVQADGDNMGKIITSPQTDIPNISSKLLSFGNKAIDTIQKYAKCSLPIYAGGDDLLFIVPVVGDDGKNIMDLIKEIDQLYENVKTVADKNEVKTSMSYGVAICYHKYPLYEAFDIARNMLFNRAKDVTGKNAIAIELRKHSGGAFSVIYSKNDAKLVEAFSNIIKASSESEAVVSAVSHKIRSNDGLLKLWIGSQDYKERNANLFEKFMENTSENGSLYKEAALNLLNVLFTNVPQTKKKDGIEVQLDDTEKTEWVVRNMYGMLRTAKFMKGEERHD